MLAVMALGSLTGSLLTARHHQVTMRWFFGSLVAMALAGFGLAWAPSLALAFVWAVPFGLGSVGFIVGANAIVQQECPPDMRSRLLALQAVAFLGSTPIGGPLTGLIADNVSAEWALAYSSVISLMCVAVAVRCGEPVPSPPPNSRRPPESGLPRSLPPDPRCPDGVARVMLGEWIVAVRIPATAAVVGAVVAPVALDRDGFPLSTYPMYSSARGDQVTLATAQAVDAEGGASTLTLGVIGESDDPLVVAGELRDAIGDGRARQRCEDIAGRAARWDGLPRGHRCDRGRHGTPRRRGTGRGQRQPRRPHGPRPLRGLTMNVVESATLPARAVPLCRVVDAAAPPERLAMLRILTGLFTLVYLLVRLPVFVQLTERASGFDGVGLASVLGGPLPDGVVLVAIAVTLATGVAYTLGWRFRSPAPCSPSASWHSAATGARGASSCTSRTWWRCTWSSSRSRPPPIAGRSMPEPVDGLVDRKATAYGWPIALAALIVVITYVITGLAKLRYGGIEWIVGDTLRNHVAYSAARLDLLGGDASPIAGWAVRASWAWTPAAAFAVLVELAAPVALGGRIRTAWVIAAWLLHAGIAAAMLIVFPYPLFLVAFAPFYRVERLWTGRPNWLRSDAAQSV